tara:strand:+ start:292 stop:1170 length:879 start_codon:yes stop_codon:yes gene_type:complete
VGFAIQRIYGGFGNQAFQISAGILICKKLKIKKLFIDLSSLSKYQKKRDFTINKIFELNNLKIKVIKNNSVFLNFISNLRIPRLLKFINVSLPFFAISDNNFLEIVNSRKRSFSFIPLRIIDGYFNKCNDQNSFNNAMEELINIKKFSDNLYLQNNSTCIHIRGNDFLNLNFSRDWIIIYYVNAINFLIQEFKVETIDIITDDIDYSIYLIDKINCSLSSKINFKYNKDPKFIDDVKKFSNYQYHILSDSTFAIISSSICENDLIKRFVPSMFDNQYKRNFTLRQEITFSKE